MATRTSICAVMALALFLGAGAEGQNTMKPLGSFTIETRATAAEQFDYASRIRSDSADRMERDVAVLRSVAALEVIPKRWPAERELIMRAWSEIISRLTGAFLHKNAVTYCDKAIAWAGKAPRRLVFLAAKGRSLMWLDRTSEAKEAFDTATSAGDFHRLTDFEKSGILADASFFYERQKKYDVAAAHSRARAKVCADDLGRADALRKAVDLSIRGRDLGAARADLGVLMSVALQARMRTLTPSEQEILRRIDASIAEYRKKLGV